MSKIASLFIAVALSLGLFHELRITAAGRLEDGNNFSWFMFTAGTYAPTDTGDQIQFPPNWRSRNVGCWLSTEWWKLWGVPSQSAICNNFDDPKAGHGLRLSMLVPAQFQHCNAVGSYYAFFYFLTCLAVVIFLKNPLMPMLGTFASILVCSPTWFWPYLMPWDIPTMTIWTAIFLFYLWLRNRPLLREQWTLLAAAITFGGLFKETVLVTALLLLAAPWSWQRRIGLVITTIVTSQVLNWIICGARPDWMFSVHEGSTTGEHKWNPLLLWPVLFANAGSIVLLPIALWRRWQSTRDWPIILVCAAFVGLQALNDLACGIYNENRDWLEIAPIAWVLIAEYLIPKTMVTAPTSAETSAASPSAR